MRDFFTTNVGVEGLLIAAVAGVATLAVWLRGVSARGSRALRAAEDQIERGRTTLASIGDAVLTTDREGRVTNLNRVAESLTGWTTGEAAGVPLEDVFRIVNETTRQAVESPSKRALREGVIVGLANHTVLIARDGTERPIDDSAAPIRDKGGETVGCVLVFRDVTERRAAERAQAEQLRLFTVRADVATALAAAGPMQGGLQACCEALVRHLGVAFARVWTHDEAGGVLVLQASAGRYTHLDGPHSRIKVGEFKIGRIAATQTPLLTNHVPHDPNVSDRAWAEREGMVAFAGYPLVVEGRVVGVMAMFARHPLTDTILDDLGPLTNQVAQYVHRKRAEENLRDGEERLRLALSAARMVAWRFDLASGGLVVSDTAADVFGLPPGTTLDRGEQGFGLVHPDDVDRHRDIVMRAAAGRSSFISHFRLVRPDTGAVVWVEDRGHAVQYGPDGAVRVDGVMVDVTQRRSAEETQARLLAQVQTERRLLDAVLDALPVGVIIAEADGKLVRMNRANAALWGEAPQSRSMAEYGEWVGYWPDTGRRIEVHEWPMARTLLTGEPVPGDLVEIERFDGAGRRLVINTAAPVKDEGGAVVAGVIAQLDVTERVRAERANVFIAGVSAALADLTDPASTFQRVAALVVPTFADWCAVDLVDDRGERRRVAVMHAERVKLRAYQALIEKYPPRTDDPHGIRHVLVTGEPDRLAVIPDAVLRATAQDDEHLRLLRAMGLKSHILVPIRSRDRTTW